MKLKGLDSPLTSSIYCPSFEGESFCGESREMNKVDKEVYIENFDYPNTDDVGKYEKLSKIGQGTFG